MSTEQSALDLPLAEIAALCRRYRVRELSLFGSTPTATSMCWSNFSPGRDRVYGIRGTQLDLSDLLGRTVDVAPTRGLKPIVRDDVLASARVVYAAK